MLVALKILLWLAIAAASRSTPRTNVVIVLMDDVGRDRVAVYGDHPTPPPTPHIDALAARGVLFRNAWAYPTCSPTRAALLTGRHSDRTGIGRAILRRDGLYTPLSLEETILPEALFGYTSVAMGKWHLDDEGDEPAAAMRAGFDGYVGHGLGSDYFEWTRDVNGTMSPAKGYYTTSLVDDAIDFIGKTAEPYFLYFCPLSAHEPFHVPPQVLHSYGSPKDRPTKHRAMVEALDTELGRLIAAIDLETTVILLLGDNGTPGPAVDAPWIQGRQKASAFEGGVRVPFIAAGKGVAKGRECRALVGVTDIFATVLDVAGLPGGAEDSISFAPLLADPSGPGERESLYVHMFAFPGSPLSVDYRALRTQRWKLVHRLRSNSMKLYDLELDPEEKVDLLVEPTEEAIATRDRLLGLMPTFD